MIIELSGGPFEAFRPLFLTKYASTVNTAPPQKPRIKTARLCRENLFTMSKPFGKLVRPADVQRYTVFFRRALLGFQRAQEARCQQGKLE